MSRSVSGSDDVGERRQYRFGIVTALPKEFAAMRAMLDTSRPYSVPDDPNDYVTGTILAIDGTGAHQVVVTLLKKPGNNSAAAAASHLVRSFPTVTDILMVGIAGGIPNPSDVDKHVRLGDIVISNEYGVIQYDNGKLAEGKLHIRDTSQKPSAALIGKVKFIESERICDRRPWEAHVARARVLEGATRPDTRTDRLFSTDDPTKSLQHPRDRQRRREQPKLHYGRIGSANTLLKDPRARDALSKDLDLRAIEMEGSGLADGTWITGRSYLLIRGISDYCDSHKNDVWQGYTDIWQGYAAVVAAAYARALIESFSAPEDPRLARAQQMLLDAESSFDCNEFEVAARLSEESAELAEAVGDVALERRARRRAARAWGDNVVASSLTEPARRQTLARVHDQIRRLEVLGERPAVLALERTLVARLEDNPEAMLKWAEEARRSADDDDVLTQADALIARLQALWQLGQLKQALELAADVDRLRSQVTEGDAGLVLEATWIRTLCKADMASSSDVKRFLHKARELVKCSAISRPRAALIAGQVASELNLAGRLVDALALCEFGYKLAEELEDASTAATIAIQISELAAEVGDPAKSRLFLGRAESWCERSRSVERVKTGSSWETLHALTLFARGRVLARLAARPSAGETEIKQMFDDALEALAAAKAFAVEHRAKLKGDAEIFLAGVAWWLGNVCFDLGRCEEAARHFSEARSDAALAHPRFSAEVATRAWLREAEALQLAGKTMDARGVLDALLGDTRVPPKAKREARELEAYLEHRVRPVIDWFDTPESRAIVRSVAEHGLRHAVARQLAPLVSWWQEWHDEKGGPESELLDFWGRGGFLRVAAAVRSSAFDAIVVDASSISDIERWARIFCPLFETVVVKWKGPLGAGLVITPVHADWGEPDGFGGHGYLVCAGDKLRSPGSEEWQWCPAIGWANPIPREVSAFLATKALSLIQAGRLVVLPAPLVGCTQSAVGWTDGLLTDNLLHGVVCVGRTSEPGETGPVPRCQRLIDLAAISIPFVDGIELEDLAKVLSDTEEWLVPLRSLLHRSIGSGDLRWERWAEIAALRNDIQGACVQLRERLAALSRGGMRGKWRIGAAPGMFSAGSHGGSEPGHEPVTDVLRSVVHASPNFAPWIPYWRLQEHGGYLDWTGRLDRPSVPPDDAAKAGGFRSPEIQSWLYPGTGGWGIPSAFVPP